MLNRFYLIIALLFSMQISNGIAQIDSVKKHSFLDEKPWPASKFSAHLGAFVSLNMTKIGAGTNGNDYSLFSLENELNMSRNTYSVLFNFDTRFGKHNLLKFAYYNINRSTNINLDKDIQFGDHVYPIDSELHAFMNTNIFRLSYGYAFVSNPKLELGALVGFHVMAFNIGFDENGKTQDISYKDHVKFAAPLPDFGLFGTYAINNRWAVSSELSYFYLKIQDFSGRILNASIYGQYKLAKHWEVDLGYSDFDVLVKVYGKKLNADLNWSYNGPFINVAYKFGAIK